MIQANEVILKDGKDWLHFTHPHRVVIADRLQDVVPALRQIDELVNENGWHAAGFLSYESAPAFDAAHQTHAPNGFPLLWFGLYSPPRELALPNPAAPKPALTWSPTVDRITYNDAIDRVRNFIAEGETYQVNYTMRLTADFETDPWDFFLHLAQGQNKHAAYVDTGRFVVCSASPELFFQLDGGTLTSRPMKGTISRGRTTFEDQKQADWLKDSEKNRAENVMIVDMIRNDMGRIARTGSVHVPALFTVEKYPTLWQMTSTVQAATSAALPQIFTALFPCASITGAPKVSTMRIIADLETTPRNIYTGSIGYIAPGRKAKFNVAIRTALIDREISTAEYGVGGGIVWDSTSTDEYSEALLKARVLTDSPPEFSLLETMLWTPQEGFFLREKHIARLMDSANYFDFPISKTQIDEYFDQIARTFDSPQRVRLLLNKYGKLSYAAKAFSLTNNAEEPLKVHLAKNPIDSRNIFLFHKTTLRGLYDAARNDFPACDDVLLFNERGELTEFTIGNLVVEMDRKLFTPPISCGLLAGTFRAHLLELGLVEERIVPVKELKICSKVFLVNSVRKWQEVEIIL